MQFVFPSLPFLITSTVLKSQLFKLLDSIKYNVTEDLNQIRLDMPPSPSTYFTDEETEAQGG